MIKSLKIVLSLLSIFLCLISFPQQKPNIIWIYAEDTSPWMGCYGDEVNFGYTPNIDSIANNGVKFNRAYVTAPVCSASRSAIIVGQNAIRFGGHQHRSSRTKETRIYLPDNYKLLPEIMIENGYTTFNHGKNDYNFFYNMKKVYNHKATNKTNFKDLIDKQPFFGQIQTKGGKNNTSKLSNHLRVSTDSVKVPADYPNNDVFKKVVAQHYEAIRMDDSLIGNILNGLKQAGLEKNTIVVYFSDHGANNLLRHKQMTTEGGLKVPFAIIGPKEYVPKNKIRNDLVSMLDLSATTLSWAGIEQPDWFEGQNLFSKNFQPKLYIGGHRDRLDHTIDRVRTIRTNTFRYVKNYKTDRILLQPQYRDKKYYTKNIYELYYENKLSQLHKKIFFGPRPKEELYNVSIDPEMINNLASNPDYYDELQLHRNLLEQWLTEGDQGDNDESIISLMQNGEGKPWGEGVNPEYEDYRVDSDGDGLSDKWERLNNRSPEDGCLYFDFNCGGWQTEGWKSENISSNLSGFLGYLDFELDNSIGSIERLGLNIKDLKSYKNLVLKIKSNSDLYVYPNINGKIMKKLKLNKNQDFSSLVWKLGKLKQIESLKSLNFTFESEPGSHIELDFIKVN